MPLRPLLKIALLFVPAVVLAPTTTVNGAPAPLRVLAATASADAER